MFTHHYILLCVLTRRTLNVQGLPVHVRCGSWILDPEGEPSPACLRLQQELEACPSEPKPIILCLGQNDGDHCGDIVMLMAMVILVICESGCGMSVCVPVAFNWFMGAGAGYDLVGVRRVMELVASCADRIDTEHLLANFVTRTGFDNHSTLYLLTLCNPTLYDDRAHSSVKLAPELVERSTDMILTSVQTSAKRVLGKKNYQVNFNKNIKEHQNVKTVLITEVERQLPNAEVVQPTICGLCSDEDSAHQLPHIDWAHPNSKELWILMIYLTNHLTN